MEMESKTGRVSGVLVSNGSICEALKSSLVIRCVRADSATCKSVALDIFGISGEVPENSSLLDYYASSSGTLLPTFRDNLSVPSSGFKNPEDGADRSSRNVGKKLPPLAA
jgi:hypothetical protein